MQAEMNKLFAEGGVMQQGGTVDPVSGNDVPPGAMAEEVRDDIPAQLSEGEFVMPADVVRYWGLEKLMAMRDKAKMGLKKMEEIGQMGNAEQVPDGEALHGGEEEMDEEAFSSEIDSILGEEGGEEERGYKDGGYVVPESEKLYKDAPLKGFEMVPMTNAAGNIIYIPHVNGEPQLTVPTGYSVKKSPIQNAPTTPTTDGGITTGGVGSTSGLLESGGTGGDGSAPSGPATDDAGFAVNSVVSPTAVTAMATVVSMVTGLPVNAITTVIGKDTIANAMTAQSAAVATAQNVATAAAAMGVNPADPDNANAIAQSIDSTSVAVSIGGPTATSGPSGTGASAGAAGVAAADAAAAAGHSDAAIGAAAQAAADATVAGLSPSQAAEQGNAAAVSVSISEANTAAAESAPSVSAPAGGTVGPGGVAPGGGEAPSVGDAPGGAAPGAAPGESGVSATGESAAGGPASGGGADNGGSSGTGAGDSGAGSGSAGDGAGGAGAGTGLAKGGFVSKPIKSAKQKGLAGRRK